MPSVNTPSSASAPRADNGSLATQATLAECCELMDEMTAIYSCPDDTEQLKTAAELFQELNELSKMKDRQIREAIQGWTRRVEVASDRAQPPEEEGAHQARVQGLVEQRAEAESSVRELERRMGELKSEEDRLSSDCHAHDAQQQAIAVAELKDIPDLRHEMALYSSIAKIQWDFQEREKVKGRLIDREKGMVVPFDLDSKHMSDFQIVNNMWDMIAC